MRLVSISAALVLFAGCTFGVKTCSPEDPCVGGGQCIQGVCTISPGTGEQDAGGGGGAMGGGGGATGGGGGATGGGGGATGGGGGPVDAGGFDAGPLEGVVFLTPPRTIRAGDCSEMIQVGVYEDAGVGEDGGAAPLVIGLANEESGFFADSACAAGAVSEFVIPPSGVVELYFTSTSAGSVLVSVGQGAQPPVNQVQSVVGAAPGRLSFGTSATLPAGTCSQPHSVLVRDVYGNMTTVPADLEVFLGSSSSSTRFFEEGDSSCQRPLTPAAIRVPAGSGTGHFRFVDSTPGLPVFDASPRDAGPSVAPASQEQTVL
ncbi:MAG: hypothetical protein Q8L48_14595 [Archangium sp.]|nr:hypothetical protein [Archangium sp.]